GVFYMEGADWVEAFLDEADAFGNPGVHDDQLDAVAGAMYDIDRGGGKTTTRAVSDYDDAPATSRRADPGRDPSLGAARASVQGRSRSSGMLVGYDAYRN